MEYYGNNDFRDYTLAHHGILGMQWGKRNGPPYPIGSSGHSASEKKAGWRKSLGGGRNEHLYDRKSESKPVDKSKKSGLQLTDKQKKALKIGAITAGVALAAVGTVYLARTGRLQQIGSAFMGGSSGPQIKRKIGYDVKNVTRKTIQNDCLVVNPSKNKHNCVSVATALDARIAGYDVVALERGAEGFSISEVANRIYKNGASQYEPILPEKTIKETYISVVKEMASYGDGARGIITVRSDSSKTGASVGHELNWIVIKGRTHFFDGQDTTKEYLDKGFYKDAFEDLFKFCDNGFPPKMAYLRTDNLEIIEKNLNQLTKNA